jgi:hypothetical protein
MGITHTAGGLPEAGGAARDGALAMPFGHAHMLPQRQNCRGFCGPKMVSQKFQKNFDIAVDTRRGPRLYTPHNEGGAPLATKEFALVKSKRAA